MSLLDRLRCSVRNKLLVMVLVPLVVALPALVAILTFWGGRAYDRLLIDKIRSDLAVANGYFERVQEGVGRDVRMLAESQGLARALDSGHASGLKPFLEGSKQALQLDFIHFVDARGRVVASSSQLR